MTDRTDKSSDERRTVPQPVWFPADWTDVTASAAGKVIGIVGAPMPASDRRQPTR